ncbi:MAG: PKD domain-containing protein [Methanomassiliicoccales archaeon]|nr:MAG: PKD domain-containing protein [Methanomassiliicoccales archaeon]
MKENSGINLGNFGKKIVSGFSAALFVTMALFVAYNVSDELIADAGADRTVDVNVPLTFDGYGSYSPWGIKNYTWYYGDGDIGYGIKPTHTYISEGIYTVTLVVTALSWSSVASPLNPPTSVESLTDQDIVIITVHNEPPISNAGVDISVYEDEQVTFDGSGSIDTPSDQGSLKYSWDLGDGTEATGKNLVNTYTKAGLYSVMLTITDNDGAKTQDVIAVDVENLPPTADAGPDQTAFEDALITFDASGSTDTISDMKSLAYSWDFGDGSKGVGDKPTHIYPKAETYTVTLTVTDDDGEIATDTMVVTVINVLPTALAGVDQIVNEDQLVFFGGDAWDTESDLPLLSYHWEFGDGTVGNGKVPTHTYQDKGDYIVTLTVTDDDKDKGSDTMLVTVANIGPVVDAGSDIQVNEDVPVQFRGYAHDTPSDEQSLSYSWDFGDGITGAGENPTHTYSLDGSYTVTLTVTDDNLVIGTDSLTVTVLNVPPTATATYISPSPIIIPGDVLSFSAKGSDSISDIPWLSYFWDFGDGTTALGKTVTHAYSGKGIYEVILTVTDDDGATAQDVIVIVVEQHSFEMNITPIVDEIMPGEKAEYVVTLENTGTIDGAFDLELTTPIDPLWIDFWEKHLLVAAGTSVKVILEIMPPETYPLDYDITYGFEVLGTCTHQDDELSNAPLSDSVSEDVTIIATYESRLRWAQIEVESKISDFSGGNPTDATLLKAVEEISEALFFARTADSPEFDLVNSFERVKQGIHNLEMVSASVNVDYIIDLLVIAVNDQVRDSINTAEIQAGADNIHVIDAWEIYADAQAKVASGDYSNGMERYKSAYMEAERAEGEWVPREYTNAILQAIEDIDTKLSGSMSSEAQNELDQAKEDLQEAKEKSDHGELQDSFDDVVSAVEHLQEAEAEGVSTLSIVIDLTSAIENAVEMLIMETQTHVGMEVNDIKQAWKKFYDGQTLASSGKYLQAIDKYDRAYTHALNAEDWIPIADAGPDQSVIEDELVYFDASNSRDRDGIVLYYEWNFGDGSKAYGVFVTHEYNDEGVYDVILTITDNEGDMDLDEMVVAVGNEIPSADIVVEYLIRGNSPSSKIVYMDDVVLFDAIYGDTPSDLPGLVFSWDFGDDTVGFGAHTRHIYTLPGTYSVVLTVTDEDGEQGTANVMVELKNVIPWAELTYSQVTYEDDIVYFTGYGFDTPSDMDTLSYTWDFGDGLTGSGQEVIHVYTDEGIYTVTLMVTDIHGDTGYYTVTVSVINPPPIADAGWIQFGDEDGIVYFIGTGFDTPSDRDLLTYSWDFGDHSVGSGATQSHTYTKAGTYTVLLTVTDDNGDYDVDEILVFVENAKPTANAGSHQSVIEDDVVSFDGSGMDSASDISGLTYYWDFGDGSCASGMNPSHVYTRKGTYLVTLTVTDDDEAWATDSMSVTVDNLIPGADAGSNQKVKEDEIVLFSGSGSDTFTDEPLLTYEWDFGDGVIGFGRNPTHSYWDEGVYPVTLTVTDDDGSYFANTINVIVENVPPTASAGPDLFINFNPIFLNFVGEGSDTPSDRSTLKYTWDFDASDGIQVDASGKYVSHLYESSGTFTLTLTITDDNGASATDTTQITIILDRDGDGLPDDWEEKYGLSPYDASGDNGGQGDPDNDDFTNILEFYTGTNPIDWDTDGDWIADGRDALPLTFEINPGEVVEYDEIAIADDLGVSIVIDYTPDDDTVPTIEKVTPSDKLKGQIGGYFDISTTSTSDFVAIIKIHYDEDSLPAGTDEAALVIYHYINNWWTLEADTGVDTENDVTWIRTTKLSNFTNAPDSDKDGLTNDEEIYGVTRSNSAKNWDSPKPAGDEDLSRILVNGLDDSGYEDDEIMGYFNFWNPKFPNIFNFGTYVYTYDYPLCTWSIIPPYSKLGYLSSAAFETAPQNMMTGDITNRGEDEIIVYKDDSSRVCFGRFVVDGDSFSLYPKEEPRYSYAELKNTGFVSHTGHNWMLGDVDNDNIDEFIEYFEYPIGVLFRSYQFTIDTTRKETSLKFENTGILLNTVSKNYHGHKWMTGDVDGDGTDEIIEYYDASTSSNTKFQFYAFALTSSGMSFERNGYWLSPNPSLTKFNWMCGDVDGDGTDELIKYYDGFTGSAHFYTYEFTSGQFGIYETYGKLDGNCAGVKWMVGNIKKNDITVDAGADRYEYYNVPVVFKGSILTDDTVANRPEYTWSWDFDANDGLQSEASGPHPVHTYTALGTYTVTLTVSDGYEVGSDTLTVKVSYLNTGPYNPDCDNDGLMDGDEYAPIQSKHDDIPNPKEYVTNPRKYNTDGDALSDGFEVKGWNITMDLNGDGDTDDSNEWYWIQCNPLNPDEDNDRDTLTDYEEYQKNTDPNNPDTDGDSIDDGWESNYGFDPG